jgi:haloalkane dehalogenase
VRVWPQEIPIDGIPERNQIRMAATYGRLETSTMPLLLLVAEPGVIMDDQLVEILRAELPRMEVENIGPGMHYVQETQPTNIGEAVANWIARLEQPRAEVEIDAVTD